MASGSSLLQLLEKGFLMP